MAFIELTRAYGSGRSGPVYVNKSLILHFEAYKSYTIIVVLGKDCYINVKESPERIVELMEEAELESQEINTDCVGFVAESRPFDEDLDFEIDQDYICPEHNF
jgi:hypothetical protein